MNNTTSGTTDTADAATITEAHRQPWASLTTATNGRQMSWPVMFGQAGADRYHVITCGLSCSPVMTTSGYAITPQEGTAALHRADTVIVPGTQYPPARLRGELAEDLRAALDTIRPGTRIVYICIGAFVLGAAGLPDDRRATTHWHKADDFRGLYPRVVLDETVLFVDDGDVLTSAGLASGIDLCLHIIRQDHDTAAANDVARYCVVPPWREGAIHRPATPRIHRGFNGIRPQLGPGEPHRTVDGAAIGRPFPDERADLQSTFPRRDRRLDAAAACRMRPDTPGITRSCRGRGGPAVGPRLGGESAAPPTPWVRHESHPLPKNVPGQLTG